MPLRLPVCRRIPWGNRLPTTLFRIRWSRFSRRCACPILFKPWSKQSPQEISGSGVVIEGDRILTNAHMVSYANQIQVQAHQSGDKYSATVVAVAPGIDLALLKLDDESFFASHAPLPRAAALPEIKDAVMTYGYPTGGTGLSITKGIVSRIEFAYYNLCMGTNTNRRGH